jgi:hypothetical protein
MSSPTNLAALEDLLSGVHDQAKNEHPALAQAMSEAVTICQSRHGVIAGVNMLLQLALASIRAGRPDDAVRYIEIAINIEQRWCYDLPP